MFESEVPDDQVCDVVREYRQKRRDWEANNRVAVAKLTQPPKRAGAKAVSPNESQGIIESFERLVAVTRTKYPRLDRRQAVAQTAREHAGVHELYLKAMTGRAGIDRPRNK